VIFLKASSNYITLQSCLNKKTVLADHVLCLSDSYLKSTEGLEKPQAAYYNKLELRIQRAARRAAIE
jgi:hypothetical protein